MCFAIRFRVESGARRYPFYMEKDSKEWSLHLCIPVTIYMLRSWMSFHHLCSNQDSKDVRSVLIIRQFKKGHYICCVPIQKCCDSHSYTVLVFVSAIDATYCWRFSQSHPLVVAFATSRPRNLNNQQTFMTPQSTIQMFATSNHSIGKTFTLDDVAISLSSSRVLVTTNRENYATWYRTKAKTQT